MLDIGNGLADRDVLDAGEADDVAGGCLVDVDPLEPFEGEELGDLRLLKRAVELADRDRRRRSARRPWNTRPTAIRPR